MIQARRLALLGGTALQAAIGVDFTQGFPANGSFSRATVETGFNASALLATYASNVPVLPYDPVSRAALGVALYGQATNLQIQSGNDTAAEYSGITRALGVTDPTGGANGATATESLVSQQQGWSGTSKSIFAGSTYTVSRFIKPGTRRYIMFGFGDSVDEFYVFIDTQTWALTNKTKGAGTVVRSLAEDVGNGWRRVQVAGTLGATKNAGSIITTHSDVAAAPAAGLSYTFSGNGSTSVGWGNQLNSGQFAAPYIATTTAAVTAANDNATLPTTGIPANPSQLTILAKGRTGCGFSDQTDSPLFYLSNGSSANSIAFFWSSVGHLRIVCRSGGTIQALVNLATNFPPNTDFRFWGAFGASDFAFQVIGYAINAQNSGVLPVGINDLKLGQLYDGSVFWNGDFASFYVYNKRLPNAQASAMAAAL